MPKSRKKSVGLTLTIPIILGILALISDFVFGWPNISHYLKSPGPIYSVQSEELLEVVLDKSHLKKNLGDHTFFIAQPALTSVIRRGRYVGTGDYRWRVNDMYYSLLENIILKNEQLEYYIDKAEKTIFIWPKGYFLIWSGRP